MHQPGLWQGGGKSPSPLPPYLPVSPCRPRLPNCLYHQLIVRFQMDRFRIVVCLVVATLVQGQDDQLDREGKKLVLKKVRKLRPESREDLLGQCPEVRERKCSLTKC